MGSDEDGERIVLLANNDEKDSSPINTDTDDTDVKKVNLKESFYILLGFTLGTGILIIPYTVRAMGVIVWIISLLVVVIIQCTSSFMLYKCTQKVLEDKNEGHGSMRDPYQEAAEIAGGNILRKFSIVFMYAWVASCCLSLLLVSASMLATFIPIGAYTHVNLIRIWITILISIVTPIMFLGTYSDLAIPALIAVLTAVTSAVIVMVNCALKKYVVPSGEDIPIKIRGTHHESFLVSLGSIVFMTGAALTIPSVTVLSAKPEKLVISIFSVFVCIFFVFLLSGLVPYYVFNGQVSTSILATFNNVIEHNKGGVAFKVLTIIIQVLMLIHLTMAAILSMNPLYLHLEEAFEVPREFNWKRMLVRTICMFTILCICLLIPQFEFAVSIAGGVPFTVMGILVPAFMYSRMFEINIYTKMVIYSFLVLVVVFIFGNVYASVKSLIMT